MSIVLYGDKNNGLTMLVPCDNSLTLDEIIAKDLPANTEYKIVSKLDIDFDFFDAYNFNKEIGAVFVSERAKILWKNKWRQKREFILEKLDKEFMLALEQNNEIEKQKIVEEKRALRDVTNIEIIGNTPEEIKSIWPDILGEK